MYLLYTDETNLDPKESDFFVYGGLAIPSENASSLSKAVDEIRDKAQIKPGFLLKAGARPDHLNHQQFITLKQAVMQAAVDAKCVLLTSIILHQIAKSPDEARRNEINRILYHFNCFLIRPNSSGLVLIDRFSDKQIDSHLREKSSIGITGLPYSNVKRLDRIVGFHYSAIGQSHFCSLIDIVLGSLRWIVNAHAEERNRSLEVARTLVQQLAPMFFTERKDRKVSELSLIFSPKVIRAKSYREKYERLRQFFAENGVVPEQEISAVRSY